MYGSIAKIYDQAGWPDFSGQTYRKLKPLLKIWQVKTHLDLACGTGDFCTLARDSGIDTMGVDNSPEMVKIARDKFPLIKFRVMDMRDFNLKAKFDLITCLFDSINHLASFKDWRKTFLSAYSHLNDNGRFLFDVNTISAVNKHASAVKKINGQTLLIDRRNIGQDMCRFTVEYGGEKILSVKEKGFRFEKIKKEIVNVGFQESEILFGSVEKPDLESRIFILARK